MSIPKIQIEFAGYVSDRLKNAVQHVLSRLPTDDVDYLHRRKIYITEGSSRDEYGVDGYGEAIPETDEWSKYEVTVLIDQKIVPLEGALRGLIAHELAHVKLLHHKDVIRWKAMNLPSERRATLINQAERAANRQCIEWGFSKELYEMSEFMTARRQAKLLNLAAKTL